MNAQNFTGSMSMVVFAPIERAILCTFLLAPRSNKCSMEQKGARCMPGIAPKKPRLRSRGFFGATEQGFGAEQSENFLSPPEPPAELSAQILQIRQQGTNLQISRIREGGRCG